MDFVSVEVGIVAGVAVLLAWAVIMLLRRSRLLQRLDIHTHGPDVPDNVLDAVKSAEIRFYDELGWFRQRIEDAQDVAGLLWPSLVFRANFSVGVFRIKGKTIEALMEYAIDEGYLTIRNEREKRYNKLLPLFAMLPVLNDWQAALLLQHLKEQHPGLRKRSWDDIAADPRAIAKLYSGYMGAGGDWAGWEADDEPGPVATYRLGRR